jgi:hypothetical protein
MSLHGFLKNPRGFAVKIGPLSSLELGVFKQYLQDSNLDINAEIEYREGSCMMRPKNPVHSLSEAQMWLNDIDAVLITARIISFQAMEIVNNNLPKK